MSEKRSQKVIHGSLLRECSMCGFPFQFPAEGRYMGDGVLYCFRHDDAETPSQRDRRQARERAAIMAKRDLMKPPGPIGNGPSWDRD